MTLKNNRIVAPPYSSIIRESLITMTLSGEEPITGKPMFNIREMDGSRIIVDFDLTFDILERLYLYAKSITEHMDKRNKL